MAKSTKSRGRTDTKAAAACVRSYIEASYARLSGDYDLPLPEMEEAATDGLREELNRALESRRIVGRDALLTAEFDLDDMEVTPADDELAVRCLERYSLVYDAEDPIARQSRGAREHFFVLLVKDKELTIRSHVASELNAAEMDALSARRDTDAASQRQKDQADKEAEALAAKYKPEKVPTSGREKAKLAFVITVMSTFLLLGIYQGGPRTREVLISLHTGERHVVETRLGVTVADSYKPASCTDWANSRLGVPRDGQRWVRSSYVYSGWFGFGGEAEERTLLAAETIQALYALQALDRRDKATSTAAITRYKTLVATLDPADFPQAAGATMRPGDAPSLASNTPLAGFIKTIQ